MADFGDLGSEITETHFKHTMGSMKEKMNKIGTELCEDCGKKIPQKRRELIAWCTCCVWCQEVYEG